MHVITVPFTMALSAPLPLKEREAHDALELGRAIAERYGVTTEARVVRDRQTASAVLRVAREEQVDAIVLGVGLKRRAPGTEWGQTTDDIMRHAECEVIVDKVPIEAEPIASTT
jgi:nucleotide-binding universal stress UspA family protein